MVLMSTVCRVMVPAVTSTWLCRQPPFRFEASMTFTCTDRLSSTRNGNVEFVVCREASASCIAMSDRGAFEPRLAME